MFAASGSARRCGICGVRVRRRRRRAEPGPAVRVNVDLQPRTGSLTELNVIGNTVDEALTRLEKFLDEAMTTDIQRAAHRPRPRHRTAAPCNRARF